MEPCRCSRPLAKLSRATSLCKSVATTREIGRVRSLRRGGVGCRVEQETRGNGRPFFRQGVRQAEPRGHAFDEDGVAPDHGEGLRKRRELFQRRVRRQLIGRVAARQFCHLLKKHTQKCGENE